jgi:ABC-type amino acid transport system permease subunit
LLYSGGGKTLDSIAAFVTYRSINCWSESTNRSRTLTSAFERYVSRGIVRYILLNLRIASLTYLQATALLLPAAALLLCRPAVGAVPLRAGIQAIHPGQREAALMIGMRERQVLRHYAILLLKDTSVASLMLRARDLSSEYFMPMQIYLVVGAIYLCMAYPLSYLVRLLGRHYARTSSDGRATA